MQYAPLDGFKPVYDMRNGTLQDHVGGIVQEPVLEHAGKLEVAAVAAEQPVEPSAGFPFLYDFVLSLDRLDVFFDDLFLFHALT